MTFSPNVGQYIGWVHSPVCLQWRNMFYHALENRLHDYIYLDLGFKSNLFLIHLYVFVSHYKGCKGGVGCHVLLIVLRVGSIKS